MEEFNFKSLESLASELKEGVFKINSGALSSEDILSLWIHLDSYMKGLRYCSIF